MADQNSMTIWDHINELRSRLLKAMAALVITTLISVMFTGQYAVMFLAQPVGGLDKLQAIDPTEGIGVYFRISLLAGFILALPIIVYQIMAYVVPGLYESEKRWLFLAIPISTLLFLSGVAFSYFVLLPTALEYVLNFLVKTNPRVSTYVDFVTSLMFWIGLAFEMPLLMYLLARFNIVNPKMLLRAWRYAVVAIAVIAAMITPTVDPVNMSLLMVPLFFLYLLSIGFAAVAQRSRAQALEAQA